MAFTKSAMVLLLVAFATTILVPKTAAIDAQLAPIHAPKEVLPFPRTEILPGKPAGKELQKCWAPLENVQGCVNEIYGALLNGKFSLLSPSCCQAVINLSDYCWNVFPFSSVFNTFLKNTCIRFGGGDGGAVALAPIVNDQVESSTISKSHIDNNVELGALAPYFSDQTERDPTFKKCWSSYSRVPNCMSEIYNAAFYGKVEDRACCAAIVGGGYNCLSFIFPYNPTVRDMIINYCANQVIGPPKLGELGF